MKPKWSVPHPSWLEKSAYRRMGLAATGASPGRWPRIRIVIPPSPQRRRGREMDRMDTEGARRRCIDLDIVDVDSAERVDREALEQHLVDARLRLDRAGLAREHDAAEPAEEIKTFARERKTLGR